ncbi:MAG: phytanoyl-CoA dioxygenase family protein [Candidatus Poribacteria bacterium]|nr:phytanoyl-CoA dioxygenase family protein [Candidatus Poribacteria bacterium]
MPRLLTNAEIEQYERDGFLAFEGLLSHSDVDALIARIEKLVETPHDRIRMQVEPSVARGEAKARSKLESFRKIEGLVEHDDLFGAMGRHPQLLPRFQDLLGDDIRLFRDALMMKPPEIGSEKPYHQDSAYWLIQPMTLCSAWIALDDATVENGCMRVIAGSHHQGVVEHQRIRDFQVDEATLDMSKEVVVPLKKGGVLFFHSLALHATQDNHSDTSRRAMILSCMGSHHEWSGPPEREPNWLTLTD